MKTLPTDQEGTLTWNAAMRWRSHKVLRQHYCVNLTSHSHIVQNILMKAAEAFLNRNFCFKIFPLPA